MENLREHFDNQIQKLDCLDNAVCLLHNKTKLKTELLNLTLRVQEARLTVLEIKDVSTDVSKLNQDYKVVLKKLQKQQLILLNMLKRAESEERPIPLPLTEKRFERFENSGKLPSFDSVQKINVHAYENSPFVAKIRPQSLQFSDFEEVILMSDFERIPKYMKGRETLEALNQFLENPITKAFNEKYTLIYKHREAVKQCDKDLWNLYRRQANYCPGRRFITLEDIQRCLGRIIDKKTNARITMLKHLHILCEERNERTVCYIWNVM